MGGVQANNMSSVCLLLLLLLQVFAVSSSSLYASEGECPLSGCSPSRCYCTQQSLGRTQQPKQVWHRKTSEKLSTKGCVANGGNIVCPLDDIKTNPDE